MAVIKMPHAPRLPARSLALLEVLLVSIRMSRKSYDLHMINSRLL